MGDIGTVQARYDVLGETRPVEQIVMPQPPIDEPSIVTPADVAAESAAEPAADSGRRPIASEAER